MIATIRNVITTADLKQRVDVPLFINYSWGMYDLSFYGGRCGYVKDEKMKGRVTVFLSGKMISTGGITIDDSINQLERTLEILATNNMVSRIRLKHVVQNIVATTNVNFKLDIKGIASLLPNIVYEPDQFPGAILRTDDGPVCLLFASGKAVIVGSKSEEQLTRSIRNLENLIRDLNLTNRTTPS